MKKTILTFLLAAIAIPARAYEKENRIDGTFRMTINSIQDDEFEVDYDGVWLLNSETIATIHLNPDSILYLLILQPEYPYPEDFYSLTAFGFGKKLILDNYVDSVKIQLPIGPGYNCNDVFRTIVCYLDPAGKSKERILLSTDDFKVIDYVRNPDCLAAYEEYTRAMAIDSPKAAEDAKHADMYFDLGGRRLAAPPAKGIYIHNGKKMVAR